MKEEKKEGKISLEEAQKMVAKATQEKMFNLQKQFQGMMNDFCKKNNVIVDYRKIETGRQGVVFEVYFLPAQKQEE